MMILRFLNIQGIAGLAASVCLALLLVLQKGETRHWKKQSGQFEQLYVGERAAFASTVANYRVAAEQDSINQRSQNAFEARLADARARAERLRQNHVAAADPGARGSASMPGLSVASGDAAQGPDQGRLSSTDALTATEQAIQLDELIKWVRAQAKVDNNAVKGASSKP